MLKTISLENFKLHTSTKIDTARLTVFIGPNNSGKSSIFQAILTLRQAASRAQAHYLNPGVRRQQTSEEQPYLYAAEQQIDLGSFEDVIHSGQSEIRIGLEGGITESDVDFGGERGISLQVGVRNNAIDHHMGRIEFHVASMGLRDVLAWNWSQGVPQQEPRANPVLVRESQLYFQSQGNFQFLSAAGSAAAPNLSPSDSAMLSAFSTSLARTPVSFLNSFRAVYALRGLEESGYPLTAGPESGLDRMMLADRTLALLSIFAYKNEVLDRVSAWLENLLGVRVRIKLTPPKRVTLICQSVPSKPGMGLFSNEGTGAGQLPFILVPIALAAPGESVMISEPEVHLHPKAQSELARLFVKIADRDKKQFLIETHSEHVLNALLNSVAKGDVGKEDLAIHYFEPQGGTVEIRRLEVDSHGRVEGGLPGFFDQSLSELTEYLETLKKK